MKTKVSKIILLGFLILLHSCNGQDKENLKNKLNESKMIEKFDFELPKPKNYRKMIDYATKLSSDFPQVRVDFYEVDDTLIFGELTFSSSGSILSKYKQEYISKLGELLVLPEKLNS